MLWFMHGALCNVRITFQSPFLLPVSVYDNAHKNTADRMTIIQFLAVLCRRDAYTGTELTWHCKQIGLNVG